MLERNLIGETTGSGGKSYYTYYTHIYIYTYTCLYACLFKHMAENLCTNGEDDQQPVIILFYKKFVGIKI